MSTPKLVDLSHTIRDGLQTYKGVPAPLVCDYISRQQSRDTYDDGAEFVISRIDMISNTGTYIDCPFHRFTDGDGFGKILLDRLVDLPGIEIEMPYQNSLEIGVEALRDQDVMDKAVLFHTGWDRHFNTPTYYDHHPYVTEEAAQFLVDNGALLAGIDSHNIDNTGINRRPVHTALLGEGILIVEHLTQLHLLPENGFLFSAVPPKFEGIGSFPVRAMAKIV